jgi:hypothetical protein
MPLDRQQERETTAAAKSKGGRGRLDLERKTKLNQASPLTAAREEDAG